MAEDGEADIRKLEAEVRNPKAQKADLALVAAPHGNGILKPHGMEKVPVLGAHIDMVPKVDGAVLGYAGPNQLSRILQRFLDRRFEVG